MSGEQHPGKSGLGVANVPDEATDMEFDEYDGLEHIIAVVDGKIVHIYGDK